MTRKAYAEVIGDPIAHSKSPLIHGFWLEKLGVAGEYLATRVSRAELAAHLEKRRVDPFWRGTNVTLPLKTDAAALVGDPTGACASMGAVNCVLRTPLGCLVGTNTDVKGIEAALPGLRLEGAKACMLGAGGAARAMFCYLSRQPLRRFVVVARDQAKAEPLRAMLPPGASVEVEFLSFEEAGEALDGAMLLANATSMGMAGKAPMNEVVLKALARVAPGGTVFDMVYDPVRTPLLEAAESLWLRTVDGLAMLIGQAAPAFEYFFGVPAPRQHDDELRMLLTR